MQGKFGNTVNEALEKNIATNIKMIINKECQQLSKKDSILRKIKPDNLKTFKLKEMKNELDVRAPVFSSVLQSACGKSDGHRLAPVCMAASVCLRSRDTTMSALSHVVNSVLLHGTAKKKAFSRLSKFGICTSHTPLAYHSQPFQIRSLD